MAFTLNFDSYYGLLALHRALIEAKFCETPNDPAVCGSALVAELANNVIDGLIGWTNPPVAHDWKSWRVLDQRRREWKVAVCRAADIHGWRAMDPQAKQELARNLLSPFAVSDELLGQFITAADDAAPA